MSKPVHPQIYSLQTQLQSATKHLSDEQHPASQEHSVHPEFAQLQPIAKDAVNKIIKVFILNSTPFFKFPQFFWIYRQ